MVAKWETATETLHRIWKHGGDASGLWLPSKIFHPTETPNPQVPFTLAWTTPGLGLPQKELDSVIVMGRGQTGWVRVCLLSNTPNTSASVFSVKGRTPGSLTALSQGH